MIFLERLEANNELNSVHIEELKLCLALRFQRASSNDEYGDVAYTVMSRMAKCEYESNEDLLKEDLLTLVDKAGWKVDPELSLKQIGRAALIATGFAQHGL